MLELAEVVLVFTHFKHGGYLLTTGLAGDRKQMKKFKDVTT